MYYDHLQEFVNDDLSKHGFPLSWEYHARKTELRPDRADTARLAWIIQHTQVICDLTGAYGLYARAFWRFELSSLGLV